MYTCQESSGTYRERGSKVDEVQIDECKERQAKHRGIMSVKESQGMEDFTGTR